MSSRFWLACAGAMSIAAGSASAQTGETPTLPDPATVKVPDVTVGTPELDASGDAKYFYFHKQGAAFETAVDDLAECFSYANPPIPPVRLPAFVVLQENAKQGGPKPIPMWGMTGALIGAILAPSLNRRNEMGNMRVCMGFKGYKRYPTTKEAYLVLNEGDDRALSIVMLAKIASGPTPQAESLVE